MATYDIVTVGGGVGGAALAKGMAERGYRVLVVERETQFRDRVRGEFVFPWGVAEAKLLGVYDELMQAGGHHPTYWTDYAGSHPQPPRTFAEERPQHLPGLSIYHPAMQEALLRAAESEGAEVRRGTRVTGVECGRKAEVVLQSGDRSETVSARLVVGADGRASLTRKWGEFASHVHPPGNIIAGVLLENVPASPDSSICMINAFASRMVLYLPQTRDSGRAYLVTRAEQGVRLQGDADFAMFLEECTRSGLPDDVLDGARQAGPLASFDGADTWVDHPYRDGCALIGDAAAASDPTWGQGLSLTLRDARALRDVLLNDEDWDTAGHAYALAHDRYYHDVRTAASWFTLVFLQPGPEADALRQHVLPQLGEDRFVLPNTLIGGPDFAPPTDENRAKIFGASLDAT